MEIPVSGWYLENKTPGHHKQYTVLVSETGVVILAWGKIDAGSQSKIQKLPSHSDAEAVGLRQVYSKQSSGYTMVTEALRFTIDQDVLDDACRRNLTNRPLEAFNKARRDPKYAGEKQVVLKHYDDLVAKAHVLLGTAGERTFEDVLGDFEELKEAWAAISDKHDEVGVTMTLVEQTISQRLMSGAL